MNNLDYIIPPTARAAADRGDIVEAVKITRRETGLGLREAKDAVDAYLHGARGNINPAEVGIPLDAIAALHQGKLIDAIRHTREQTGSGLKDSKEAVEHYLATHPELQQQFRSASRRNGDLWRLIRFMAWIALAAGAIHYLITRY